MADHETSLKERIRALISKAKAEPAKNPERFILECMKFHDLDPLFDHLRARLSPTIARAVIRFIESSYRRPWPNHIFYRNLEIAYFIHNRLAEGVKPSQVKGLAAQKFKVSKSTIRDVYKAFKELIETDK